MKVAADPYSEESPLVEAAAVEEPLEGVPVPIALTGGTGFIGSHLVDVLCAARRPLKVLVRDAARPRWIAGRPVEWVEGSLDDADSLDRLVADAGTVLHLAGVVRGGRASEFDVANRAGTARLVAAIRKTAPSARLITVSSLAAAGPSATPAGVAPGDEPRPISAYGRSKLAAEHEARKHDGLWTVLRPPAVYGPRDTDVFEFFKMAQRGAVVAPGGERWLTMAYVGDVVRAVLAAASAPPESVFHIGDPEPCTQRDLVRRLAVAGGVRSRLLPVPSVVIRIAGFAGSGLHRLGWKTLALTADKAKELTARHWTSDTSESMASLGLFDPTPFSEGATATWAWYRAAKWLG